VAVREWPTASAPISGPRLAYWRCFLGGQFLRQLDVRRAWLVGEGKGGLLQRQQQGRVFPSQSLCSEGERRKRVVLLASQSCALRIRREVSHAQAKSYH